MKTKILILGAGIYQVPLIKKAAARGCTTLVASTPGSYRGIEIADAFYAIDIRDIDAILALARSQQVAAVLTTGSDAGIPAIGAACDALGLPGMSLKTAQAVCSKTAFRRFLQTHGFPHPAFRCCCAETEAVNFYKTLKRKAVFKPDDASGSRGITLLDPGLSAEAIRGAYQFALQFARNGIVCAEAFIDGIEMGGDAFLVNGEMVYFTTTEKHLNGVLVQGHSLPHRILPSHQQRIEALISRLAAALEYGNGPLNFDIMVDDRDIYILEMGLRNGGNGIVDLIYHSEGVDLLTMLLDQALGDEVSAGRSSAKRSVSSYVFGAGRPGILQSITPLAALQSKVPEVFDMVLAHRPGDQIEALLHNANLLGYLLMEANAVEYPKMCAKIKSHLHIELKS